MHRKKQTNKIKLKSLLSKNPQSAKHAVLPMVENDKETNERQTHGEGFCSDDATGVYDMSPAQAVARDTITCYLDRGIKGIVKEWNGKTHSESGI